MINDVAVAATAEFQLVGDPSERMRLANHMQSQYEFLGLRAPERRTQARDLFRASKSWSLEDVFDGIAELYGRREREYQYVAIELAQVNVRRMTFADMQQLSCWVAVKPWRDTVDAWRKVFSAYVQAHQLEKEAVFALFFRNRSIWMRRIAVLLQLTESGTVNTAMLTQAVLFDQTTDDLLMQKAIGWALRNYGKHDPVWVRAFLRHNGLSQVARREAQRYLLNA